MKTVYAQDTANAIQAIDTAVKGRTPLLVEGVTVHNAYRVLRAYTTARQQLQQQQSDQHDDKICARTVYFNTHQHQLDTSLLTDHSVTLVNMSVTVDGLVERLLEDVLKFTRPDLYDRAQSASAAIATAHATCVIADQAIEAAMLECAGSILDDAKLTQLVGASYTAATILETEQEEKRTIDIAVTAVTDPYSLTAKRVCAAFVATLKLAAIAAPGIPVVTYAAVRNAWNAALQRTRKQELVERNSTMLVSAWELCCNALPQHAVVQCAISAAVSLSADVSLIAVWTVVETRPSMLAKSSIVQQSQPAAVSSWLSDSQWQQLLAVEAAAPTVYCGLCASFSTDSDRWCDWYACDSQNTSSSSPVQHDEHVTKIAFPAMWGQLSDPHLFILSYILNRSGTTASIKCKQFIEKQLGSVLLTKGVATEVVNSVIASAQSNSQTPINCHGITGIDAFDTIRRCIDSTKSSSSSIRMQVVQWSDSITKATQTVTSALTSGDCLVLNVHSCYALPIWLPAVASTLRDYGVGVDTSSTDSSKRSNNADIKISSTKFRLYIASELQKFDVSSNDSSSHEASIALQQLLQYSNNVILSSEHDNCQQLQAVRYDTIVSNSAMTCDEMYAFVTNMELPTQLQTRDTSIGGSSSNSRKLGLLPLGSSLIVEVQHLNTLLATASHDINSLRRVLQGYSIMTSAHAAVYNKLQYGHVPQHWLTQMRSSDDSSYTSWIEHVQNRSLYLSSWSTGSSAPLSYNISTLVEPAALLSAIQQALARERGVSVERVEMIGEATAMTSDIDITTAPAEGYYLYGLQLFGGKLLASNESNSSEVSGIVDLLPGEIQCKLPVIWVRAKSLAAEPLTAAVASATTSPEESAATGLTWYKCPIQPCDAGKSYKSGSANTIGYLLLSSTLPTSHWQQKSCTILY
eukprot:19657-Heterococcus_DN1.PRE.5